MKDFSFLLHHKNILLNVWIFHSDINIEQQQKRNWNAEKKGFVSTVFVVNEWLTIISVSFATEMTLAFIAGGARQIYLITKICI